VPIQKVEISVTTQSQPMQWGNLPKPNPPKFTMNGVEVAQQQAYSAVGWKLLIIDATKDITNPASYLFNSYIGLTSDGHSWSATYGYMYNSIFRALYVSGNVNQQLVLLASYGMDNNMPPTREMMPEILELGGGARFQWWETHCNPGSMAGGTNSYISFPVNYVLIGYSSFSYGQGWETFDAAQGSMPVTSTLSATVSNIVPG
jgi:hypothetical protein